MTTTITICETCTRKDRTDPRPDQTCGEALAELVEAAARANPALSTRRHACLMACETACSVAVQAPGKMGYAMTGFTPLADQAAAIVTYAAHHAESRSGVVNWALWPEAVKGHFAARLPPLDRE